MPGDRACVGQIGAVSGGEPSVMSMHLSWSGSATERLGHYASQMLIASILAAVAIGLFPPPGLLALTVPVAVFAFVIVSFLMMRAHDRSLCEQCMGAMPLNAAEEATRLKWRFWTAHTGSEPRFLIPYLVLLLGSNFTTTTPGRALWAGMQLTMVYLILAQATHRRLQPWCPWCSEGGGGEDSDVTPPVMPRDDRQLT